MGASGRQRLSSSYGRRLQGRAGADAGIPDPLQCCRWRVSSATYPVLLLAGHHITSIPVTIVPCERLFSTAVTAQLASLFSSPQAVNTRTPLSRYFVQAGMCERMHLRCIPCLYRVWCQSSALVAIVAISRYRRGLCHDIAINEKSMIRALVHSVRCNRPLVL